MARLIALLLALGVGAAGCSSCSDVGQGRYACDPKRALGTPEADAQCPGRSRCGLEGYCHDLGDTRVAWLCRDSADCENGWSCGLSRDHSRRECHDPQQPDAGFACETSGDCTLGWHCGPAAVCYDLKVKAAYACRFDAGDCSDGWRCGLDHLCHDATVPDAYPCKEDPDCEGQWRCAIDQRCVDSTVDALRPRLTALGPEVRQSPLLFTHPPELLEVSPVQNPVFNSPRQSVVTWDEGRLTVVDLAVGGVPPMGTNPHRLQFLADAGPVTAIASLGSVSLDALGRRDVGSWTYVAYPTGELMELHFRTTPGNVDFDGGVFRYVETTYPFGGGPVDIAPDRITIGSTEEGYVPTMTAFDQRPFVPNVDKQYFYGWGAISRAFLHPFVTAHIADLAGFGQNFDLPSGNRVVQLTTMTAHRAGALGVDQTDCTIIADRNGLSVQQTDYDRDSSFVTRYVPAPLIAPPFTHGECEATTGVPQSHRITHLAGAGSSFLAVGAIPLDGGVPMDQHQVALIDVSRWWDVLAPNDANYPFRGCTNEHFEARCATYINGQDVWQPTTATTVLGPCRVCAGGALVAVSVLPTAAGAKLEVRCRVTDADAGSATDTIVELAPMIGQGTQCFPRVLQSASALSTDAVKLSTSNAEQLAFAGPRGHLWVGRSSSVALPLFFDEAAQHVVADGPGLPVFFTEDRVGWFAADFGLLAFRLNPFDGDRPVSSVEGAARQWVTASRALVTLEGTEPGDLPKTLVPADAALARFEPPYHAAHAVRRDGVEALLASANDAVFAAHQAGPKPVLARRLVPAEGKAIVSLLAVANPAAGPLLTAYALTTAGLYRVTAESEQLWTSTPVPLPAGDALELWADGSRGRIGFSDGRVYSLETRVPIGAPLGKKVDDFAQVCGQPYALAEGTLNRLVLPAGEVVGVWRPVPLPALPPAELEQGSLLPFGEADGGTALYVFSRRGEVVRAPVTGCAP